MKSVRNTVIAITAVLLVCFSGSVSAEIYKWTNTDGDLIYSQSPPPAGVIAELIESTVNSDETTANVSTVKPEAVSETKPEERVTGMSNCKTATTNIAMLRSATPETGFIGADDQQLIYTQAELNANIKTNQDFLQKWCKDH